MRLKALVNNLNAENRLKGSPITLNMFSYVNLGDNQAEYDDFIENKTDIAIFLIEDRIGEKTREEFLLATRAWKKTGTPKVLVFMSEFKEKTPEIAEAESFVNENTDSYYIEYSNLEDLELKVKDRLTAEVDELVERTKVTPRRKMLALKIWSWIATVACLALMGYVVHRAVSGQEDVTLLFIGGGSAVSCLEENEGIGNVYEYENSICLAVPTSTSWPVITSEVQHQHARKVSGHTKLFYPVCLSAMEAEDASFLKMSNKEQFVSKGSVLAYHLADDYLAAYVKKSYHNQLIDGKDTISIRDLAAFLKEVSKQDVMIFTTEEGSGTLTYYQKSLEPYNMTVTKAALGERVDKFTDLTPMSKIRRDETPYIMLGSRYYVAKEVYKEGDCRAICVVDEQGNAISKSIFLYFAGYYADGGASYWIPDVMVDFLRKLDPRFGSIVKNNRIPRENERVIVSLNGLLDQTVNDN